MFGNIRFLSWENLKIQGVTDDYVTFVLNDRLKDRSMWKKLVQPFYTEEDSDGMWRGEFFGKEMRGASLAYRYTGDRELYAILTDTVRELLSAQDDRGRIATYACDNEFFGWDMWCRKYVLTGLLHFYDICEDDALKSEVLSALKKHADYIISRIGKEEGKKNITETSSWWGCVNSCTILEPMLALYRKTNDEEYLKFAEYIISTGGSSDCNFLELALENRLMPYEYPVVKAYETMSFFEGLLAYYEITGEEKYLRAVKNFVEAVNASDMTIIGCAGCTHELFDNSSERQTEYSEQIMQETCVTVTWMRLSMRLFLLSGDPKYVDRIEKSGFNALYGSLNLKHNDQYNMLDKKFVKAMTFDSYSPLYLNSRGRGTGGYLEFKGGGFCGCCVAIGSCGIALMPLAAAMRSDCGTIVNLLFDGEIKVTAKNGEEIVLKLCSGYPSQFQGKIVVQCKENCEIGLFVRIPEWSKKTRVNGREYVGGGYADLSGTYENGAEISVEYFPELTVHRLNGRTAFTYGAITLAADEEKCDMDLSEPIEVGDEPLYRLLPAKKGEIVRMVVGTESGKELLLTDYQSCGKNWRGKKNRISVWLNGKDRLPDKTEKV